MQETKIEWTDFSASLLKYRDESGKTVWACCKVSDGCRRCYAETIAHRYGRGGPFSLQQMKKVTPYFDEKEARKIISSKKLAGKRVFMDDMTDLFGSWVPDEIIDRHFAVFALRPDVTFQVLTKRPERMAEFLNTKSMPGLEVCGDDDLWDTRKDLVAQAVMNTFDQSIDPDAKKMLCKGEMDWPLRNVWLGASAENQQAYDQRRPHLEACPASVRFWSLEPLLGPIDLFSGKPRGVPAWWQGDLNPLSCIGWVIVGGESGPGARPMHPAWARDLRGQSQAAGVPFFFKQWGEWRPRYLQERFDERKPVLVALDERKPVLVALDGTVEHTYFSGRSFESSRPMVHVGKKAAGRILDGRTWDEMPAKEVQYDPRS